MKRKKFIFKKKVFSLISIILLSLLISSCATKKNSLIDPSKDQGWDNIHIHEPTYLSKRGNDLADIFTCVYGTGLGVKARFEPINTGLLLDIPFKGLRGGSDVKNKSPLGLFHEPDDFEITTPILSQEKFNSIPHYKPDREKQYTTLNYDGIGTLSLFQTLDLNNEKIELSDHLLHPYYYDINAVVAFFFSLRFGFNIAEFFDFILGWTTLDILNDDLKDLRRESFKTIEQMSQTKSLSYEPFPFVSNMIIAKISSNSKRYYPTLENILRKSL